MSISEVIEFIIKFLTGMSIFLFGMKIMGDGLEKAAGNTMRKVFAKISNNRFVGLGVGTLVTAIIHSSAATTIMAVGFVNAGVMTLFQATNIIMGANIGTTITGLLIALDSLDMSLYMTIPAFVGIFMMLFFKKDSLKQIGTILAGMGIIFVGLNAVSDAVSMVENTKGFQTIFNTVDNPFLLMIIGMLITALIQSSTAVNALIIMLAVPVGSANGLDIVDGLYIILGTNVGTCITALIASAGTNANAKRTSVFHLLFNVLGTVIFAIVFVLFDKASLAKFMNWAFGSNTQFQIAWFNFFQNLICSLLLLPFSKQLVKLTTFLVKDKKEKVVYDLKFIDDRYLATPSIAMTQVFEEIVRMGDLAKDNFKKSYECMLTLDSQHENIILANEKLIDNINIGITDYVVKLSSTNVSDSDNQLISSLYHVVSDIERIGDHSINLLEFSQSMQKSNNFFTQNANDELRKMCETILDMYTKAFEVFVTKDSTLVKEINRIEDIVDNMKTEYSANHIKRLSSEECTAESGMTFYGILTDLERIADHLVNIARSVLPVKPKRKIKKVAITTEFKI